MKGLKRNGELDRDSKILNKNNFNKIFEDTFDHTNLCYLTIRFNKIEYVVETLLWKDEADNLKKILTFPCTYKIQSSTTRANKMEIKIYTMSQTLQRLYKDLDETDFAEYIIRVLQGY